MTSTGAARAIPIPAAARGVRDHDRLPPAGARTARGRWRTGRSGRAISGPAFPTPGAILLRNVYGWFAPAARGVYALTQAGRAALERWPQT